MLTLLTVAQQGEQILSLVAAPISKDEFNSEWLRQLFSAMLNTMQQHHGVGIAAPQVYISKRAIIVASKANPRYPHAPDMPPIFMLNPELLACSEDYCLGEEGCLSVPEQRGQVARAERIRVQWQTLEGEHVQAEFSGFVARIVQHEVDHLNGVLFTERLLSQPAE